MHGRPNAAPEFLQCFVLTGRLWRFFLLHISICTEVCFLSVASSTCSGATFQWPSPQTLLPFRHCTSIDGSLRVIYLTDACCRDKNCSLPNLVEIMGALVIEHSTCKADLSGFLPHLAVIRGCFPMGQQQLSYWEEYPLVIRNTALTAIGLHRLRVLGKLRIALWDNPSLCYVNSIHWASLTLHSSEMDTNISPINSRHAISWLGLKPFCLDVCPNWCHAKEMQPSGCWSDAVCQTGCSVKCTNTNLACYSANPNLCCDPECLAACTGPGPDDCVACRHVFHNGRCLAACPGEYLQLHNHRCISRGDCVNFTATSEASPLMYSIEGTMCVPSCSLGYVRSALGECIPCLRGECRDNECGHVVIYKMSDLDQVRGCSSVMSLVISLEECYDTSEADLYVAFENLREIFGSLRVLRSDSLSSLNFLRHLRAIHGLPRGETTKEPRTALEIVWNRRLKHLWNVTGSLASANRIVVPFGSMMFSLNQNLCPEAIRAFVDTYIQMDRHLTALELELIYSSNGETAVCSPQMISVYHVSTQQHNMQLIIDAPTWSDPRQVLPLTLHYRIARRASSLPWRESICASGWFIREPICTVVKPPNHSSAIASPIVSDNHTGGGQFYCRLDQLKAATLYEAFIEIKTILNREGASSPLFRFNTLPNTPSVPLLLSAYPTGPYTVRLSWSPPADPNGVIIAYQIWYRAVSVEISTELQRRAQTCTSEVMQSPAEDNQRVSTEGEYTAYVDVSSVSHQSCTSCVYMCRRTNSQPEKSTPIERTNPFAQLERILFEDRLQNFLLSPKSRDSIHYRRHRDTSNVERTDDVMSTNGRLPTPFAYLTAPLRYDDSPPQFIRLPAYPTEVVLTGLNHYTEYLFGVSACHNPHDELGHPLVDKPMNESISVPWCSAPALVPQRTKAIAEKDTLDTSFINVTVRDVSVATNQKTVDTHYNSRPTQESYSLSSTIHPPLVFSHVEFEWLSPPHPNGVVLFYWLRYRRVAGAFTGQLSSEWSTVCCPERQGNSSSPFGPYNLAIFREQFIQLRNLWPGVYEFQFMAVSLAGNGSWTPVRTFEILESSKWAAIFKERIFLPLALCLVVLLVTGSAAIWVTRRSLRRPTRNTSIRTESHEPLLSGLPHVWELTSKDVYWDAAHPLGEGSFGTVYSGTLQNFNTPGARQVLQKMRGSSGMRPVKRLAVAIKTTKSGSSPYDIREFVNEAAFMKNFTNDHIVQMLGILVHQSSHGKPPALVMELMSLGDLATFLRQRLLDEDYAQGSVKPSLAVNWAAQIASGMAYLSSLKLIHRDLAARNCLVNDALTVKIADGNQYYRKRGRARLPIRWMSPEALASAYFTIQSDVWSYGVVIWEIVTFAALPFSGLSHEEVIEHVTGGGRLEVAQWPTRLPSELQTLMLQCWSFEPSSRITFSEILSSLESLRTRMIHTSP
ncbi:hypothetical protein CRM22_010378 [Opisthorchis felineus]|uniref:receptor protein-tyrosine kinase n=1 Tax=Opisthorchis felineus TaxID=147828 RepID=A0A4S2L516_OPIFE|nr:hypothetical protein CRM22_010378 [Opisthorchis felineus]